MGLEALEQWCFATVARARGSCGHDPFGRDRCLTPGLTPWGWRLRRLQRLPARERELERGRPARLAVELEGASDHADALADADEA